MQNTNTLIMYLNTFEKNFPKRYHNLTLKKTTKLDEYSRDIAIKWFLSKDFNREPLRFIIKVNKNCLNMQCAPTTVINAKYSILYFKYVFLFYNTNASHV